MKLQELPVVRPTVRVAKRIRQKWDFHKSIKHGLKWHHEDHDLEVAERTTPPSDEDIRIKSVWITEAYPPSHINSLFESLERLGWNKTDRNFASDIDLIEWIKKSRTSGNTSSWNNAGILLRNGDIRFPTGNIRRGKLPKSVDYGYISIHNITQSLTLVTINFILKDEASSLLNAVFAKTYKTGVEYFPSKLRSRRAAYIDGEEQKRRAINMTFSGIHKELSKWFSDNIPGYFSKTHSSDLPVTDFITSTKYKKSSERNQLRHSYFELLNGASDAWQC